MKHIFFDRIAPEIVSEPIRTPLQEKISAQGEGNSEVPINQEIQEIQESSLVENVQESVITTSDIKQVDVDQQTR